MRSEWSEYNLIGGNPHVVKHWRGRRYMWKAGVERSWRDIWVGSRHRPIAEGHEVWVSIIPCLPFHCEWWDIGPAVWQKGKWL